MQRSAVVRELKKWISSTPVDTKPKTFLFPLSFGSKFFYLKKPPVPEILGQTNSVEAKTSIFNRYSLVAPQS